MADGNDSEAAIGHQKPRLFLSYTRADIDAARPIISILENAGFDVWWDGLLEGGVHYLPTTEAALENADCVVVLWSKLSVDSNWVRDEAQSGRERGRLVPVSLDGTMSPLGFRQIQLLDITGWKGDPKAPEMQRVITAISGLIASHDGDTSGRTPAPKTTGIRATTAPAMGGGAISRRNLILGGASLATVGAGLAAWQFDLLPIGTAGDAVVAMAVLRFSNLNGDDEQSWFSDGLSNELRQVLARNPRLRVSAPTSSTALEDEGDFEIGRTLGVPYILRGSVQLAEGVVRITAELAQVADGVVRWGETYDREFSDVFSIQSEIAQTVALSLVAQIASEREAERSLIDQKDVGGTNDIRAYEALLRGLALVELSSGVESDRAALAQFDAAIAADPAYAKAYAMRANQLAGIANATSDAGEISRLFDQALEAAERSIELEPALASGHLALGFILHNGKLDRAAAQPHYKQAQELAPGDADVQRSVAIFYAFGDKQALATQMIDEVIELDPLNARAFRTASFIELLARDYSAAITRANEALALNPNFASVNYSSGTAWLMQGDFEAAQKAFAAETVPLFGLVGLAIVRHKMGDTSEAREELEAMVAEYGDASLYQQVQVYAGWGDISSALATFERAVEAKDPGLLLARNDPLLDPLRTNPRFQSLLLELTV